MISVCSTMTSSTLRAKFAYAIARGDDRDVACVNRYDVSVNTVNGNGVMWCDAFSLSPEFVVVSESRKDRRNVSLAWRNSNTGRRMTHASIGLTQVKSGTTTNDCRRTHWSLNSSLGGSTGLDANARSGRSAVSNDPKTVLKVGRESSAIFWYALHVNQHKLS